MLLEGLQLPLTTPFFPDGRLNLFKLEQNVARYSKTPAAGLVALSGWGESEMLSDEELRLVLKSVAGAAVAEKVLVAGISQNSVARTLDMADSAASFGYDAVLVGRPSLAGGVRDRQGKALLNYFLTVADRSAIPVVLYDSGAGGSLPVEVIISLAGHPNIFGLVDQVGGRERLARLLDGTSEVRRKVNVTTVFAAVTGRMQARIEETELIAADRLSEGSAALTIGPSRTATKTRTKIVGFQMLSGRTAKTLDALRVGAVGAMPGFAAAAPQACYEVLAAWKDGDEGLAEEKQIRLERVAERLEDELGVAGIKSGCDVNGYFGGAPRLPLLPLTGEERTEIEMLMQGLRN